jgi:hypothetical protein
VTETGLANLEKVDHIVVLMLENRSFDHMLGYLSLEGGRGDVDGLREEFANEHDGRSYPVHHLDSTVIEDDPDHSASAVDLQIGGGKMNGFVTSFAETLSRNDIQDADPGRVIGYYNAADVPVYDHLASEFAICDRWFSSVPGATWPNRLYAICGRASGSRDDLPLHLPPMYNHPSFVRHLDANGISWRWYSFEAGTLRFADGHYKLGHHDSFAFFSKTNLNWRTSLEVRVDARAPSFLEDAANGALPSVSWIDPAFSTFNPIGIQPQRRPPARGHQGRPGACARRLPRARSKPPVGKDAPRHLLRRTPRLLRSRRAACGARRRSPDVRTLRRADTGADRLAVGGARVSVKDALRSHVDLQDDSSALLPRGPRRAKASSRTVCAAQKRRACPPHGNARVAGQ